MRFTHTPKKLCYNFSGAVAYLDERRIIEDKVPGSTLCVSPLMPFKGNGYQSEGLIP